MGLFGKRKASADELAALQGDVGALRARLEKTEQALSAASADSAADRAGVDGRFDELSRRVDCVLALARRVDGLDRQLAAECATRRDEVVDALARIDEQSAGIDRLRTRIADVVDHRDELDQITARLDDAADLRLRLDELALCVADLPDHRGRLEHLQQRVDGLPDHDATLADLAGRLDAFDAGVHLLADVPQRLDHLTSRLDSLPDHAGRLDRLAARIDALPDDDGRMTEIGERLGRLDRQLAELSGQACAHSRLAERLGALDARMIAKAAETDAQLSELAGDVDALATLPPAVQPSSAPIDELRAGQKRLAIEQTRFQIALRDDLAGLAEQVRRVAGR